MPRIAAIDPAAANAKAKPLLDAVQAQLGVTPNMMRTMAQSPALLEGYLALSGALAKSSVRGPLGELIALAVAEANQCTYCLSAHSYLGEHVARLDHDAMDAARRGESSDPKTQAALQFALQVNDRRGHVTDQQLDAVRAAGHDDVAIANIIGHVALNVLTNSFNSTARVDVDFPVIEPAHA